MNNVKVVNAVTAHLIMAGPYAVYLEVAYAIIAMEKE